MKDYKKILEGVIDIISATEKSDIGFANICTYIGENCPELAESEDEKTKKSLMQYIWNIYHREYYPPTPTIEICDKWIAWLEKQGERKPQRIISAEAKEAMYDKPACAWSEEDKRILKGIIGFISHSQHYGVSNSEMLNWLKSLKQRIVWKPSEEQMRALHDLNLTGNISYAGQGQVLIGLYNDLKKLRGE